MCISPRVKHYPVVWRRGISRLLYRVYKRSLMVALVMIDSMHRKAVPHFADYIVKSGMAVDLRLPVTQ